MSRKRCQATKLIEDLRGLREIRCEEKAGHEREHWSGNYAWLGINPTGSAARWERVLDTELARLDVLLAGVEPERLIWIAGYEDTDGNFHDVPGFYARVNPG